MSSFLILFNIAVFAIIHIMYSPSKYDSFLEWPKEMDKWLLDIELIKHDKKYLYQVVTSLFLHSSYLHLVGNVIFALYIMYELEYAWKPAILWGLLGGVAAQCLAVATL
jgi:membrane associated rhomboid family serine protease